MKADRPLAAIRHGVGQQQYLDLCLGKAAAVEGYLPVDPPKLLRLRGPRRAV